MCDDVIMVLDLHNLSNLVLFILLPFVFFSVGTYLASQSSPSSILAGGSFFHYVIDGPYFPIVLL